MRAVFKIALAGLVLLSGIPAARADYFVWRDPASGMSLSFPDSWQVVSNKNPDDVVTINAPSGRAFASCRVQINSDRRYMIYPQRFNENVQHVAVGADFWNSYVMRYDNPHVYSTQDSASLGRGWAGYAEAGYQAAVQGPYMDRDALMMASLYNGKMYVVECSSNREAFSQWRPSFLAIANSVDFVPAYHQLRTGDYRNFLGEPKIRFPNIKRTQYDIY